VKNYSTQDLLTIKFFYPPPPPPPLIILEVSLLNFRFLGEKIREKWEKVRELGLPL